MAYYATRAKVFRHGLPAAAFVRAPRTIEAADASADTLLLRGHGLSPGDPITFALEAAPIGVLGAPSAALPAGLSASLTYYALPSGSDLFQVTLAPGGAAVAVVDAGSGVFGVVVDFGPDLDASTEAAAGDIDKALAAHGTPIPADQNGAYPEWLVALNARLAAADRLVIDGLQNPLYSAASKQLLERVAIDRTDMEFWKKGAPVPGLSKRDATPAVPEAGARSWSLPDRGWSNAVNGGDLT